MVYFLFVILFVIFFTCKDNVLFCLINFIFDDLQGFFRRKSYLSDKIRDFIDEIQGFVGLWGWSFFWGGGVGWGIYRVKYTGRMTF